MGHNCSLYHHYRKSCQMTTPLRVIYESIKRITFFLYGKCTKSVTISEISQIWNTVFIFQLIFLLQVKINYSSIDYFLFFYFRHVYKHLRDSLVKRHVLCVVKNSIKPGLYTKALNNIELDVLQSKNRNTVEPV